MRLSLQSRPNVSCCYVAGHFASPLFILLGHLQPPVLLMLTTPPQTAIYVDAAALPVYRGSRSRILLAPGVTTLLWHFARRGSLRAASHPTSLTYSALQSAAIQAGAMCRAAYLLSVARPSHRVTDTPGKSRPRVCSLPTLPGPFVSEVRYPTPVLIMKQLAAVVNLLAPQACAPAAPVLAGAAVVAVPKPKGGDRRRIVGRRSGWST